MLYFEAKMDVEKMLSRMLRKRRGILRKRKVTNRYLSRIMPPVWQRDFLKTKIKNFFTVSVGNRSL
jgi:hypothetical protein